MHGKIVIVTGASSGIGRAAASTFAEAGAVVIGVGRNDQALVELSREVASEDGSIVPKVADLEEDDQIDRLVTGTVEKYGKIDVVVNAAGIIGNGSIETTSPEEWDRMFNINLRSMFILTQKCVPHLATTQGNIVNVSSVAGTRSFPNVLAYCVSKAGVDQFTRCTALELAPKGIRVNAVNPGVVVTSLHKRAGMDEATYQGFLDRSKETHPIGRVGRPEEVADLIHYLASDKAGWITGVTYEIDGGRAQTCAR
jgi:NAD(P)-dependent dehydrogenase (short-subunit alcohol dehydrogenase family)